MGIALATIFELLAKVTKGGDTKLVKWANKWGLLEIWLGAAKWRTYGPKDED